jgi:hypothetical protein
MDSAARPNAPRRRHLAIAGAVVLAALTTPAAAAMPLMQATAPRPAQPSTTAIPTSTSPRTDTHPRTPAPAFVLDKGRFTAFDAPPGPFTFAPGNNNRGQIVGFSATGGVTDGGPIPTIRGFLLRKGVKGPITPIAFPGAPNTLPNGINDLGQIVGAYQNPDIPPNPQGTSVQPPNAMSAALAPR